MHIGYARVSTEKQSASIEAQEAQLTKAGCEQIYKDENQSGGKRVRPALNKALDHLRKGDVFIVCKLDRLSRSLVHLLGILKKIDEAGAKFRSLDSFARYRYIPRPVTPRHFLQFRCPSQMG